MAHQFSAPQRSRFPRRITRRMVLWGVLILAGVSLVWFAVTALIVRSELQSIKADLSGLRAAVSRGDLSAARKQAADISDRASTADLLSSGPVWWIASEVPGPGDAIDTVRGLAETAHDLSDHAVPDLITVADDLQPSTLRTASGGFDLQRIARAAPLVDRAMTNVAAAARRVGGLPADTWLGSVNAGRTSVLSSLTKLSHALVGAGAATRVMPELLGAEGPKRYFIGLMNDAESRGIGGIPGSFAIALADHGRISLTHLGSDTELDGIHVDLPFGADYAARYAKERPMVRYIWSDISPHFPYGAQIWAAMWQKKTGQRIDGAVALDPTALSYLLAATGSLRAHDGTVITASNVVALTQSVLYMRYPLDSDQPARKKFLTGISGAVDDAILGSKNTRGVLTGLIRAAGERRLLVWSNDPTVEKEIAPFTLSGVIPTTRAPYVGPVVTSGSGNKLDYYIDRDFRVTRSTCQQSTDVTVTAKLTNHAPRSGLSHYVTTRPDRPAGTTRPGDQNDNFNYFATDGATLVAATLNGQPVTVSTGSELGHPVFQVNVELPAGQSRTVVLTIKEPPSAGQQVTVLRQPMVRPLVLDVRTTACR